MKKFFTVLSLLVVGSLIGCHFDPCLDPVRKKNDNGKASIQNTPTTSKVCKCDSSCKCLSCKNS